jgi:metal-responsive CopG/Arc/MetJ family transcriptional regulator
MGNVKTAISIQEPLFEQVDKLAREMHISRSHLFALALEEYLQRVADRKLLEQLNAAYGDVPDQGEQDQQRRMRVQHRRLVEGAW